MLDDLAQDASPDTLRLALATQRAYIDELQAVVQAAREEIGEARATVAVAFALLATNAEGAETVAAKLASLRQLIAGANLPAETVAFLVGHLAEAMRAVWEITDSVGVLVA